MSQLNTKAWGILTPEEKMALTLKVVQNLSTLQAGEIMQKAHYKYLEILERAKAFIKIFSEHLQLYDEVIPSYVSINMEFREFLMYTMVQRLPLKEACCRMSVPYWMYKNYREKQVVDNMLKLSRSNKPQNIHLFELIKEFDRWNNHRILPYSVQDPSAFKRRNKNADIKNMKHLYGMNPYSVKRIAEKYGFITRSKKAKLGYFVVFSKELKTPVIPTLLKNKYQGKVLADLGRLGIYVFKREEDALEYHTMVVSYLEKDRDCVYGQKFWPKYRLQIKKSLNYNFIRKVIPSRKHFIKSLSDFDLKLTSKN